MGAVQDQYSLLPGWDQQRHCNRLYQGQRHDRRTAACDRLSGSNWSGSMDTVADKAGELLGSTWCDRLGVLNQEAVKVHPL